MPAAPEPSTGSHRMLTRPRLALLVLVGVLLAGAVAVLVWPRSAADPANATPGADTVSVSRSDCGQGWDHPKTGTQTLLIHNSGENNAEVDVVDVASGKVYGEVDGLGVNTSAPVTVTLGPGHYAIRCVIEDADPINGPTVTVSGPSVAGNPAVVPVTSADLLEPLKQYQAYLGTGVADLVAKTDALAGAVHASNLAQARTAWLAAHLSYEKLGAAYNAFGDYDGEINGTQAGLPGGVSDPKFTGFHRVEYGLWHGENAASLAGPADQLAGYVHGLQHDLPQIEPQPVDLGLRAHEIMENTLQFELTGQTDEGSGTNLATAQANLAGDAEVLTVLRPLLTTRYPQLSDVDKWSARFGALVAAQQHPDGSWTPVQQLSGSAREQLNGTLSQLVELLAPVATICEPRRTS